MTKCGQRRDVDAWQAELRLSFGFGVSGGRQQADFGAAGIESCVLNDDRYIGLEYRRIGNIARHRFWIVQIVEFEMQGAARADGDEIRPDRFAIGEENGDANVR